MLRMRIFVITIMLLGVIVIGGFYLSRQFGDVRPALLPAAKVNSSNSQTSSNTQKVGTDSGMPFQIAEGFTIGLFAENLGKARDLEFSPEGILLVSDQSGRVLAMPDQNKDGVADEVKILLSGLRNPHGLAFYNGQLYVAEETVITRYNWNGSELSQPQKILDLPVGGRHVSRTIDFDKGGTMYVSLGSRCDVCFEDDSWIGAVISATSEGKNAQIYSSGLRNAVFITMNPETDTLWGTEMGRDFLGDNLPPDEINLLEKGNHYGWPVCYGDKVYDTNFGEQTMSYCDKTVAPVYKIPAHSAPLGLTFINSKKFPESWQGDLLVSYHGSWNSSVPVGYKVIRLDVEGENVTSETDFITGFIQGSQAAARPVDLIFDEEGYLFLSDDKRGVVYIVGN